MRKLMFWGFMVMFFSLSIAACSGGGGGGDSAEPETVKTEEPFNMVAPDCSALCFQFDFRTWGPTIRFYSRALHIDRYIAGETLPDGTVATGYQSVEEYRSLFHYVQLPWYDYDAGKKGHGVNYINSDGESMESTSFSSNLSWPGQEFNARVPLPNKTTVEPGFGSHQWLWYMSEFTSDKRSNPNFHFWVIYPSSSLIGVYFHAGEYDIKVKLSEKGAVHYAYLYDSSHTAIARLTPWHSYNLITGERLPTETDTKNALNVGESQTITFNGVDLAEITLAEDGVVRLTLLQPPYTLYYSQGERAIKSF